MSGQGDYTPSGIEAPVVPACQTLGVKTQSKTLNETVKQKRQSIDFLSRLLKEVIESARELSKQHFNNPLRSLVDISGELKATKEETQRFFKQDSQSGTNSQDIASFTNKFLILEQSQELIKELRCKQDDKVETSLKSSRHSRRNKPSTISSNASSAARMKALTEAVMAGESAQFEKLFA